MNVMYANEFCVIYFFLIYSIGNLNYFMRISLVCGHICEYIVQNQEMTSKNFTDFQILVFMSLLCCSVSNVKAFRYDTRHQYENHCGDLAISCVANCPAFREKCFASSVADSIRDSVASTNLSTPTLSPGSVATTYPIITVNKILL